MGRRTSPINKAPILGSGGTPAPWYLSGGVSAANCIAAYQPIGAVDYAGSKVNLANLGTYDANNEGTHVPTWDVTTKWNTHHNLWMKTGISGFSGTNKKVILERKYPLYMGV